MSVSWKFAFGGSVVHTPHARKGLKDKYFVMHAKKMHALKFQKCENPFSSSNPGAPAQPAKHRVPVISLAGNRRDPEGA